MIAVASETVSPPAAKPSLKAQAVRGSMWQGITLAISQLLRLPSSRICTWTAWTGVLARAVSPSISTT